MNKGHGKSILVVEDDYLVAEMVKGMLKENGYTIAGDAENGHEAVEMIRLLQPDVVVMDIKMPRMNGIDSAILIQKHFPTPVVILSAYESEELTRRAIEAGVGAYVSKPPKVQKLVRAIEVAAARFNDMVKLREKQKEYNEALKIIETLSELLPICLNCKKIKVPDGTWLTLEQYIETHSDAKASVKLCPECKSELED